MKKEVLAVLLATSVVSSFAISPVYVDANVGVNTSWSSLGLNANAGYIFNRYFSLEGGFTYSPGYDYNYAAGRTYSSSYWMFDGAAKGVLPLNQMFDLYGKIGLGFNNYSSWDSCEGCSTPGYYGSNVGVLLGVGAAFHLSQRWQLHLEDYTVTGPNPNFFMFGGQYNF